MDFSTVAAVAATNTDTSTSTTGTSQEAEESPPVLPAGARVVVSSFEFSRDCTCLDCGALRENLLFNTRHERTYPLEREAPHEYARQAPRRDSDAWFARQARGDKLVRAMLSPKQLKIWDLSRSLYLEYASPYDQCGCGECDICENPSVGLLLIPTMAGRAREYGHWEFNARGRISLKRNIWSNGLGWSYEDEVISFLLYFWSDPDDFIRVGCRDPATYHTKTPEYKNAVKTMKRIGRLPITTAVRFATGDMAGTFAGKEL